MSRNSLKKNKQKKQLKINREILKIAYVFSALFFAMAAYFVYFQVKEGKQILNNPHNKRQQAYEKEVVRGKIISNDGDVLAYTDTGSGKDGEEKRVYPYKNLFCHVIGLNSHGKSGLESAFNYNLLSSHQNAVSQLVNDFQNKKKEGDNITTTLDVKMQQAAYNALGSYKGAFMCIDPSTGKVLSMVSKPDYNPNTLDSIWEEINNDSSDAVLVNRATQGRYTPGSVFKIFTTLEYIRTNQNYQDFSYYCKGSQTYDTTDQYTIKCYDGEAHGQENLESAFANSCNSAFSLIGSQFDGKKFSAFGKKMLFDTQLPIEIESNKSVFGVNAKSDIFAKTQTAIGQGTTTVSPLHMTMIASAIANNGVLMKPYLVSSIDSADGNNVKTIEPTKYKDLMTKQEAQQLQQYMKAVVDYGTATVLKTDAYEAAGKTGTAELDKNNNVNSWFVGYITKGKKKYAVCCVLENIQEGSGLAASIIRNTFDSYLSANGN